MSSSHSTSRLGSLYNDLKAGSISRRQFVERSSFLGVSTAAAIFMANTAQVGAQDATPAGSPVATPAAGAVDPNAAQIPSVNT